MGNNKNRKKIYIPQKPQFPQIRNRRCSTRSQVVESKVPLGDAIEGNADINFNQLAILVNTCHLIADINEQLAFEIHTIINKADPTLRLQFQRPVTQIKNHAADMVRFVDNNTNETFSEGFGIMADALKEVILGFVNESMVRKE